jgi:hypothetical protein
MSEGVNATCWCWLRVDESMVGYTYLIRVQGRMRRRGDEAFVNICARSEISSMVVYGTLNTDARLVGRPVSRWVGDLGKE